MKTLVVLGTGPAPERLSVSAGLPRQDYLEIARRLDADIGSFRQASVERGRLFTRLFRKHPITGSVVSAFLRRNNYSRMFTTGEDIGFRLAFLLRAARWPGELTMTFHKCTTPRRKKIFRLLGPRYFAHLICVSRAQKKILVEELGFPAGRVTALFNPIDEKYFNASDIPATNDKGDYVFSCGLENRNYSLLCQAAALLPYPFRVAASGFMSLSGFQEHARPDVPPNMILEPRLSFDDLKQTYAHAKFVVVPVNDVPYAAGVTGLLEAMAMGKALIVTASSGIEEYIRPGLSALVVPPEPAALADAIRTLWKNSARCAEMGRHNRAWVETEMNIDSYCEKVTTIVGSPAI